MLRVLLCLLLGHRWKAFYDLEMCPVAYLSCERCGANYHACDHIDWSEVAQRNRESAGRSVMSEKRSINLTDALRRKAITQWWERRSLREFIDRLKHNQEEIDDAS